MNIIQRIIHTFPILNRKLTRPRNFEKLSDAMEHGLKIATEHNIKQTKGLLYERNPFGKVLGACALGMAQIGVHGVPEPNEIAHYKQFDGIIEQAVVRMNDKENVPVEDIIKRLRAQNL